MVRVRAVEFAEVVEENAWLIANSESESKVRVRSFVVVGEKVLFPVNAKLVAWSTVIVFVDLVKPVENVSGTSYADEAV